MLIEQNHKLLLEAHLAMVHLLVLNVMNGFVQQSDADTEGSIFHLPSKQSVLREGIMHPFGRPALDELQCLGDRNCGRQREQDMNVVGHSAHLDGLHLVLPGNPTQKRPEPLAQVRCNLRSTVLSAQYTMPVRANV